MGMGPIIWTCLALSLHQAADHEYFMKGRGFKIPVRVNPNRVSEIQALTLLVSKDRGKTWEQVNRSSPDVQDFIYQAPADGSYWFIIQQEDRAGKPSPFNPERVKPNMAVIVDTAQPQVKVTAERLPSGEIRARWTASDAYPDPHSLRLEYHTSALPDGQWTPLATPLVLNGHQEFDPGKDGKLGEVRVRVQMKDQAGNEGADVCVLPTLGGAAVPPTIPAPNVVDGRTAATGGTPVGLIPPARNDTLSQPNQLTSRQIQRSQIEAPPGSLPAPLPPPSPELSGPAPNPAPFASVPIAGNADPMPPPGGNSSGTPGNSSAVQIVKARQVRIDFAVGKVGPSGLGNADVYVSFDKGASWKPMQGEVPVSLPQNADLRGAEVSGSVGVQLPSEGIVYGFIVAVKSKAGLAPPPPKPGDPPQALVEWDNTPPKGKLFKPLPDPTQPNTLLLGWAVEDRNLGDKPITLEWAELKDGPWTPIGEGLANTGQFAWRLPERLPPRVHLRLTMRDLAGNVSYAQTDKPELIDLSVPQTRIIGVAPAAR